MDDTPAITVHVGHPRVRPHVVSTSNKAGLAKEDLITSFIVVWQPIPTPPPLWIRFLKEARFGDREPPPALGGSCRIEAGQAAGAIDNFSE